MTNSEDLTFEESLDEYLDYCEESAKELGVSLQYYIEEFELW